MKGLLFASFGTTHQPAREKQIDAVFAKLSGAMPERCAAQAYTSGMVRGILAKRGIAVPDVTKALCSLAAQGVEEVLVQPGHLLPGEEYDKLCRLAAGCRGRFAHMDIARPLLASTEDIHRLADILSEEYPERPGRAVVLMGHGTSGFANTAYAAMDYRFKQSGRADVYVGTVEAYPSLETLLPLLRAGNHRDVLLAPLMLVAGDHALNDMAGEGAESWATRLRAAGYRVECRLAGLGELPAVQALYLAHALQALAGRNADDL